MGGGRTGISIFEVKDARDRLIQRGKNPSIDAIRMELGNTGSKTTISRYLKELDEQGGALLENPSALSEAISGKVNELVQQIHGEAQQKVDQARAEYNEGLESLSKERDTFRQEAAANQADKLAEIQKGVALKDKLKKAEKQLEETAGELRNEQTRVDGLKGQLSDAKAQIQSLEDKHEKARDSLEHFREESQRQRQVELDRHEAEKLQLQQELRTVKEALAVKQDESAHHAKEAGALASQLAETRNRIHNQDCELRDEQRAHREALQSKAQLEAENKALANKIGDLEAALNDAQAELKQIPDLKVDAAEAKARSASDAEVISMLKASVKQLEKDVKALSKGGNEV